MVPIEAKGRLNGTLSTSEAQYTEGKCKSFPKTVA